MLCIAYCVSALRIRGLAGIGRGCVLRIAYCVLRIGGLGGVAYCVLRIRIAYRRFGRGCVLRIAYPYCVLEVWEGLRIAYCVLRIAYCVLHIRLLLNLMVLNVSKLAVSAPIL